MFSCHGTAPSVDEKYWVNFSLMVIASREELLLLILWRSPIALAVESGSDDGACGWSSA